MWLPCSHYPPRLHETGDVAEALLAYAKGNQVTMIIMGAATHGLHMQRLPFEWLGDQP